jgi:hypothetical protein
MKTNWISTSVLSVLGVLVMGAAASAQSTYATPIGYEGINQRGYGYDYDHASTLEEGVLRGLGYLRAATGEMNYLNSLSNINNQEAISRYLDNREKNTEVYFKMRQINRAARAAERPQRLSPEQQVAIARQQAPEGLNPGQYNRELGRLSWPAMLTGEAFAEERVLLERAFAARTPTDVGTSSAFHGQIRQLAASMEAKLQGHLPLVSPNEYIAAKKFVQGLTVESQQPMIFGALAAK